MSVKPITRVKRLTRVTCAAGLLLTDLAPTGATQALEPPDDLSPDLVPVGSDQHPKTLSHQANEITPPTAAPEKVTVVETIAPAPPSNLDPQVNPRSVSLAPPPVAPPERFESQPITTPPVESRSQTIVVPQSAALGAAIAVPMKPVAATMPSASQASRPEPLPSIAPETVAPTADRMAPNLKIATVERHQTKALDQPVAVKSSLPAATVPVSTPGAIQMAASTAIAQAPAPTLPPTPAPISPKVGGIFTSGPGVGYTSSFSGIKAFVPIAQRPGQNITFAEGQAFVDTGNGNPSTNLVIGHRFVDPKSDRVYGGYLAYDHRNTGNGSFNQLGLGVEALGKTWDARINGYLPIGNTRQLVAENTTTSSTLGTPFFQSNFLAANRTIQQQIHRQFEAAAAGVDAEAGGKIAALGQGGELRGYGGLYYFGAPGGDGTVGVRGRLEARPNENLQLGVTLSRDNNYGTTVALSVGVLFPTNRSTVNRDRPQEPLLARLGDPVGRNANIVLDRQTETQRITTQAVALLNNPATGRPWQFRHAIPGVGTGDGTFENPTGNLAAALAVAQPDDIVYVQPGTNPGIPAFTIPDGVQVLSTGPVQRIDTVQLGNIALPLSGAGVLPTVQDTVTMGNNTTLSGFAISSGRGSGILGNNISRVTIRDNAIANTGLDGILLNNVQGPVTLTDNTIQQARGAGILVNNTLGQVDLLVARNQITNNGVALGEDGVSVELRNNATGNVTIINNAIANNGTPTGPGSGVNLQLFNAATGNFNVAGNAITGNQENGVNITLESASQGMFNVARNTLSNNQQSGASIGLSDNARVQSTFDGNTISSNQLFGVLAIGNNQSNSTINITNNAIGSNQTDGVFASTSDQARMNVNLLNNTILNNARDGFTTAAIDTSQLRFRAEGNTIATNGISGVQVLNSPTATVQGALRGNTVTGNLGGDVIGLADTGSTVCLQAQNNVIGSLTLDDLSLLGQIQVEDGANLATNNSITTLNLLNWSGTSVSPGTCGF
jgi:hypothetical protein